MLQAFNDAMALIGSLVAMVLVIVLTYFATRWYAGRMSRSFSGKYIRIVDKTSLGPGQTLLIVQVGEKHYLIGSGEKDVRLVCELPDFAPQNADEPAPPSSSFPQIFRELLSKASKGGSRKDGGDQE